MFNKSGDVRLVKDLFEYCAYFLVMGGDISQREGEKK